MPYDTIDSQRASVATPRIAPRWLGSLGLVLASCLAGLVLLEIACRLMLGGPHALTHWPNLVLQSRLEAKRQQGPDLGPAYVHDPELGYLNAPGYQSWVLNFDAHGLRRMPPLASGAVQAPPILATGDSYTKGDEVGDAETWPAQVQILLGWRTINAGVGAYGLDQTVLHTERLVKALKPAVLVLGFIADDVRRAEMSRLWGREKPYFEFERGSLVLRNVPVPMPRQPGETLTPVQALFGWSVLLDTVLDRLRLRNEWHSDQTRVLSSGTGERLACPLMRRVAALGVPTLVVAQYLPSAWDSPAAAAEERRVTGVVLRCAEEAGLATLDVYPRFDQAIQSGGRNAVYGQWHPNWRGYRITGEAIASKLEQAKLLP
ncbi:MAG TPA: GDSL-type esterase/lipase family protein [Reyranella sp.]|nr:GDSL-type esterase/lipase family protein [Reyranella sp.]